MSTIHTLTYGIGGMTCASCVGAVERSVKGLKGIESAQVNLATEKGTFMYDPSVLRASEIRKAIEDAGYRILENEARAERERRKTGEKKELRGNLFISLASTLPLFYLAMGMMIPGVSLPTPFFLEPMRWPLVFALTCLVFTLPAIWAGQRFYKNGFSSLLKGKPGMDSLVAIGTLAALVFSVVNTIRIARGEFAQVDHLYYETASVIITLILLGKYLEARAKERTSDSVKALLSLVPPTASLVLEDGTDKTVQAEDLVPGDRVRIRPGERFAADGTVFSGSGSVDESMISGESLPVEKTVGSAVTGGSLNTSGSMIYTVEKTGEQTFISSVVRMVEDAQASRAPIACLADRVSSYFVPVVMIIAFIAAIAWFASGAGIPFALTVFTAILLVACPCALGLATPTAIMVGTGMGAEQGLLYKNGEALETCASITTMVFDKTGTLTYGKPMVSSVNGDLSAIPLIASLEAQSEHPLAKALVSWHREKHGAFAEPTAFTAIPGGGVEGTVNGKSVLVGSLALLKNRTIPLDTKEATLLIDLAEKEMQAGNTVLLGAIDGEAKTLFALRDTIRDEAREVMDELRSMGIKTVLLSGDNQAAAQTVGALVGVDRVIGGVLPAGKADEIKRIKASEMGTVAMIGDGINDAPALASADVGIAIGSGTDAAIETSSVVLVHDDLFDVIKAVRLSKATMRTIRQNLFWAFAYNVILIPVAAGILSLFGGPLLNPIFAAFAMAASSVSVVSNALLLRSRMPKWKRSTKSKAAIAVAAAAILFASCSNLDVIKTGARKSFVELAAVSGYAASGDSLVIETEEITLTFVPQSEGYGLIVSIPIAPLLSAGLDLSRLSTAAHQGIRMHSATDSQLELAFDFPFADKIKRSSEPAELFDILVSRSSNSVGYHHELDHYGFILSGGAMLEWAADVTTNDKDIVLILPPAVFEQAGFDAARQSRWLKTDKLLYTVEVVR